MYGKNPKRGVLGGNGESLEIQHIFATLQGEGPFAGWPAVFIRLGGCNLACEFCDTEFENFRPVALGDIVATAEKLASVPLSEVEQPARAQNSPVHPGRPRNLIVITGGEPLRQPIAPLCEALLAKGFKVQLETNGTLWRPLPEGVEIICSPKNTGAGYAAIRPDLLARISAFKFILSAGNAAYREITIPDAGPIPIYVQPMDEYDPVKNKANRILAAQLAATHGYLLSLQLHKVWGLE